MPTYRWDPSENTDDYVLERSVDNGLTWTNITTIAHDYTGPNYDTSLVRFFYVDAGAVLGELVRVYGRNAEGDGEATYIQGPVVSTTTCRVFGVLRHAVTGQPLRSAEIQVVPSDRPLTTRMSAGDGVPATSHGETLGGKRVFRVFSKDDGRWEIDLVRGITVMVTIPETGFRQSFIVPEDRDVLNIVDSYIYRADGRFKGRQNNSWTQGPRYLP